MDAAREKVLEYRDIFEPGSYFLELQPNGMEAQERLNPILAELGESCDVPLVATNDCHYVNREEAHAHEVLMCMGQGRTLDDPKRMKHECDAFYIKRPDEMAAVLQPYPQAFENAGAHRGDVQRRAEARASRSCRTSSCRLGCEDDLPGYLRRVASEGLEVRWSSCARAGSASHEDLYRERLASSSTSSCR
jgi:DNA polymerase-3 subunit alpha